MLSTASRGNDTIVSDKILHLEFNDHVRMYAIQGVTQSVQEICRILGFGNKVIRDYEKSYYVSWEVSDREVLYEPYGIYRATLVDTLLTYGTSLIGSQDIDDAMQDI